jgi:hypothetical protein
MRSVKGLITAFVAAGSGEESRTSADHEVVDIKELADELRENSQKRNQREGSGEQNEK